MESIQSKNTKPHASDLMEYLRLVKQAQDFRVERPALNDIIRDIFKSENALSLNGLEWDLGGNDSDVSNQVQSQK